MREILFRGKEIDNREWVYGYVVSVADISRATIYVPQDPKECDWATLPFLVAPDTVGQFTGLLDKYGNKIFEGDILHGLYGDMLVCFGEIIGYGMGFMWKPVIEDGKWESITGFVDEYEVIGNKWDNPELLNP